MRTENNSSSIFMTEPSQVFVYSKKEESTSISLLELIYQKFWIFLVITALTTLIALAYSSTLKTSYKTTVHLSAPQSHSFQNLYLNTRILMTPEDLFNLFLTKLNNKQHFNAFIQHAEMTQKSLSPTIPFLKYKLAISQNPIILKTTIRKITGNGSDASLSFYAPEATASEQLAKAYLNFTNQEILNQIAAIQHHHIAMKIIKLTQAIQARTDALKAQKLYQIDKLQAEILQLERNPDASHHGLLVVLKNQLLGHQYDLQALMDKHLASDKTLLHQQSKLQQLNNLSFDTNSIESFHSVGLPETIKNNNGKSFILALGILSGLIISLILVVIQIRFYTPITEPTAVPSNF